MKQFAPRTYGTLLILLASVGYGTMPVISQLGFRAGLSVETILSFRLSAGAVILWSYLRYKGISLKVSRGQLGYIFGLGILATFIGFLITSSYMYLPGVIATLGMFSYVIMVMIMELLLGREVLQAARVVSLGLAVIGLIFVVWDPSGSLSFHPLGLLLAFGAAFFNALYIVGLGSSSLKGLAPEVIFAWLLVPTSAVHTARALLLGQPVLPQTPTQWFYALYLAVFVSAMAGILFFKGMKRVGGTSAALINMTEPVVAYAAGVLLIGDRITVRALFGGSLIILSLILLNLSGRGKKTVDPISDGPIV